MSDKLSLQINAKEIGQDVLRAAIEKRKKDMGEKIVWHVGQIIERQDISTQVRDKAQRQLDLYASQLKAIEDGEFSINEKTGEIIFNNPDHNKDWAQM